MLSSKDHSFIMHAKNQAKSSPMLMKHGAIAVANGKIVGRGYNHYRSNSSDKFINNMCACHAEIASLRNMFHTTNAYGKHGNNIKGRYQEQRFGKYAKIISKNNSLCCKM